jgi:hypothetical protein
MLAPTIPNPMNPTCLSLFLLMRTLTSSNADNTATNRARHGYERFRRDPVDRRPAQLAAVAADWSVLMRLDGRGDKRQ